MAWRALLPFLRPLVPVAVDYARARMQTVQQRVETEPVDLRAAPVEALVMRLADAEAQIESLAGACNDLGGELARLSAEANARIKSARRWALVLLGWNVALTAALLVMWLR